MKPDRARRVGELIKREVAQVLSAPGEISEEFFFTVTEVRLSRNLQHADVWVSIYGDETHRREALGFLRDSVPRLRRHLSRVLYLRHTPELRFELDETLDKAERIESILNSLKDGSSTGNRSTEDGD